MVQQLAANVMQQLTGDVLLMLTFLAGIYSVTNLVDVIFLRRRLDRN
jgi:hypothetical protein